MTGQTIKGMFHNACLARKEIAQVGFRSDKLQGPDSCSLSRENLQGITATSLRPLFCDAWTAPKTLPSCKSQFSCGDYLYEYAANLAMYNVYNSSHGNDCWLPDFVPDSQIFVVCDI